MEENNYRTTTGAVIVISLSLGRPTKGHELSFFLFYQYTAFSSHAVDGHQMYFGGSVVGKASTIGIEISLTPPLIFTGGSRNAKFGVVLNITQL